MINKEEQERLDRDAECLKKVLDDLPPMQPSKAVDETILSAARDQLQRSQTRSPWYKRTWGVPRWAAVGACAAAVILALIGVFEGMQNSSQQRPASTSGMAPTKIERAKTYARFLLEFDKLLAKAPLRTAPPRGANSIESAGRRVADRSRLERPRMRYFGSNFGG
jgi:hypothetical protein